MSYFDIALKLITGMVGILFFLRVAGKVSEVGKMAESYLLVNNGAIVDSTLMHCNRTRDWVLSRIKHYGYNGPTDLFCLEWTPGTGFYLVAKNGDVRRGTEEILAEEIGGEVLN